MLKLLKIGRHKIEEKEFAFDGCHKIYLITNKQEKEKMIKEKGWEKGDFFKIAGNNLEQCYYNTCPLRFIDYGENKGYRTVIPQCSIRSTFTYLNTGTGMIEKHIIDFHKDNIEVVYGS